MNQVRAQQKEITLLFFFIKVLQSITLLNPND